MQNSVSQRVGRASGLFSQKGVIGLLTFKKEAGNASHTSFLLMSKAECPAINHLVEDR